MDQVIDIVKLNKFIFQRKKLRNLDNKGQIWMAKTGD